MKSLFEMEIAVVGLGLMGGSVAKALAGKVAKLIAVDTNPATLEQALASGIADEATASYQEGVATADLVVLATPVKTIAHLVSELPTHRPDGCYLIDVGSTKVQIGRQMAELPEEFEAVGGHPICGREHSGLSASKRDLFRDQTFVLCRNRRTTTNMELVALEVIDALGANPLFMPPQTHDSLLAVTSHLPYLTAALLMRRASAVAAQEKTTWQVSASGFRDASRLAGSSAQMMLDILLTNSSAVQRELREYQRELSALLTLLEMPDTEALARWLAAVEEQHADYRQLK